MKKKLSIGILIDQLVSGGVQKSAIQEARNLKLLGHSVTIFVLVKLNYSYQYEDLTHGLKVVFLSDYNPHFFKKAFRIPYFGFLTHLHILNPFFVGHYSILKKIDFLISHGTTTCITASSISKKFNIPYMAFVYDPMLYILEKVYSKTPIRFLFPIIKPLTKMYESSFLLSAALVATLSKTHQEYIKTTYHIDPLIIRPGSNPYTKPIIKQRKLSLLGYTRWELAKNPQFFIWLAKKFPNAHFILAGTWPKKKEELFFKNIIQKNKLEKQIEVYSSIKENDLLKLAERSLAWIHPHFEAFGMAGLEVANLGLPIIIPKNSGVSELFEEGKEGFFPHENNKKEFAKHVKFLLEHPTYAQKMGHTALLKAKEYTWEKHSKVVLTHIQTYLSQTKIVAVANAFVATYSLGGGDRFLIELIKLLPSSIHLTIITPTPGYYHLKKYKIENSNIRFVVLPKSIFDNHSHPLLLFAAYTTRSIQTIFILSKLPKFKILHTATDFISDTIPAFIFVKFNKHTVWAARFFHFFESPLKREGSLWINTGAYILQQLSIRLLRRATFVMVDNPLLEKDLVKKGISKEKIEVHPGGANIQEINNSTEDEKYTSDAIFIGRLQEHKGALDAIEIWSRVLKMLKIKKKLIMIGYSSSEMQEKLNKKIKQLNLQGSIQFTGHITDRFEIAKYCKSSKLLLFLDHEAGFGLVVTEAMAAGLPIIAYNLPLFGTSYKKGFMTSQIKDFDSVAKNVVYLLKNKEKYSKVSKEALQEAKKFDWKAIGKLFYSTLTTKAN